MARQKKKQVENTKRHPYPEGEAPTRLNTSIPEWLQVALAKAFDLGHRGNGKKASLVALGLTLVLYGVGYKFISITETAGAIVRLFPGSIERQAWASNLRLLADQLGEGVIPEEPK